MKNKKKTNQSKRMTSLCEAHDMTVLIQLQVSTWQFPTLTAVSCEESSIITCYSWPEAIFLTFKDKKKTYPLSSPKLHPSHPEKWNVSLKMQVLRFSADADWQTEKERIIFQNSVPRLLLWSGKTPPRSKVWSTTKTGYCDTVLLSPNANVDRKHDRSAR